MKHQQQTKKLNKQQTVRLSKALPSLFFMSYASEVRAEPCRLTTIYISNFNNFAHNKPNEQANSDIRVVFSRIWYIWHTVQKLFFTFEVLINIFFYWKDKINKIGNLFPNSTILAGIRIWKCQVLRRGENRKMALELKALNSGHNQWWEANVLTTAPPILPVQYHCTENIIQNNITSASPIGLLRVLALDALVEKKISWLKHIIYKTMIISSHNNNFS